MVSPVTALAILAGLLATARTQRVTLDKDYWERSAKDELAAGLNRQLNTGVAKNVIIFIGDGMGPNTVLAARIFKGGEQSFLSWERFPHIGAVKTYSVNKQVPDSASTATAIFTGVKVNYYMLGLDSVVKEDDCDASLDTSTHLTTVAALAQNEGKATGIISTMRVTHATPAAMYAHAASRNWECDALTPKNCKDIARQLIEDAPGKYFNVIMGGGRQAMKVNATGLPSDPLESKDNCIRADGRDLIKEWVSNKARKGLKYAAPENARSLRLVDTKNTDYLLGIFSNTHYPYDYQRDKSADGMPSLEEMTTTAIKVLVNNPKGFLLMAEGGLIDMGHHDGKARKAIEEVMEFNKAVNGTLDLLEKLGILDETLIIVTSDHAHTLSVSGYPDTGNNILGIAMKSPADEIPYTTLGYANGGPANFQYNISNGQVVRDDPTKEDTTSIEYSQQAAVKNKKNTHGGNDVFVYARGPYAHLFHCIHEQNYIAEVVKYSARLGEYNSTNGPRSHGIFNQPWNTIMTIGAFVSILTFW